MIFSAPFQKTWRFSAPFVGGFSLILVQVGVERPPERT
jgi:hypothetical protein